MGERETTGPTPRIAIVGSGPAGFYAAEALLRADPRARVDLVERLPSPFGLVRSGVAPDHPKLKQPIRIYEKIAGDPRVRFLGNVTVGRDAGIDELLECYHAVILACGAQTDRRLAIPGEDLPGSHSATAFVGWYNAHPDFRDQRFDLSVGTAAVIGVGNVALDVCRILARTPEELARTDIAAHALEALAASRIRDIHLIGRRGPLQARFTHQELRELAQLEACDVRVDPADLELDAAGRAVLEDRRNQGVAKSLELLRELADRAPRPAPRRIHIHFLRSPLAIEGAGRVERLVLGRNRLEGPPLEAVATPTGETETLPCGLVLRSVGYRGTPLPGVPFDETRGVIPTADGRVVDGEKVVPGLYATGWIKRGATGLIGTNRADGVATVKSLLDDIGRLARDPRPGGEALERLLAERGVRVVSFADWCRIDAEEVRRGEARGKPREKFTRVEEMLAVLGAPASAREAAPVPEGGRRGRTVVREAGAPEAPPEEGRR